MKALTFLFSLPLILYPAASNAAAPQKLKLEYYLAGIDGVSFYGNENFEGEPVARMDDNGFSYRGKIVCPTKPRSQLLTDCKSVPIVTEATDRGVGPTKVTVDIESQDKNFVTVVFQKEKLYVSRAKLPSDHVVTTHEQRAEKAKAELKAKKESLKEIAALVKTPDFVAFRKAVASCLAKKDDACLSGFFAKTLESNAAIQCPNKETLNSQNASACILADAKAIGGMEKCLRTTPSYIGTNVDVEIAKPTEGHPISSCHFQKVDGHWKITGFNIGC